MVCIPEMAAQAPILFELPARPVVELALVFAHRFGVEAALSADTPVARIDLGAEIPRVGAQLPLVDTGRRAESVAALRDLCATPAARSSAPRDPATRHGAALTRSAGGLAAGVQWKMCWHHRIGTPKNRAPPAGLFSGSPDPQQFDLEDQGRASGDGTRTPGVSIRDRRRTDQPGLSPDLHLLNALRPAGNDLVEAERRGLVSLVRTVKLGPVDQRAAVVSRNRIGGLGRCSSPRPQFTINQSRRGLDRARLRSAFGE